MSYIIKTLDESGNPMSNSREIIYDDGTKYTVKTAPPYGLWEIHPVGDAFYPNIFNQQFTSFDDSTQALNEFDTNRNPRKITSKQAVEQGNFGPDGDATEDEEDLSLVDETEDEGSVETVEEITVKTEV